MKEFFAQNKFLLKFMLLSICGGLSVGISQIAITLYAIKLEASTSQIGLIQGVQSMGVFLTVLPMGFLIDHFGAKRLFIFGCSVGALIYLFLPLANTVQLLLIGTAALGLFMSFRFVSLSSVFLDYLQLMGNEKAGWFRASHSIGMTFLGPLLGGFLVKHTSYHWTFFGVSLILVVTVITAAFVLTGRQKDNSITLFSLNNIFPDIKSILKNKEVVESSIAEGLAIATFSCFTTFIVVIALRIFHLPQEIAAIFISVEGLVFIVSLFSLGALLEKIGQRNFYLLGISMIVLSLFLLGIAQNPILLWPGSLFLGVGLGMLNLINVTRIGNTNTKKGKVAGVFALFTVTGMMLGPVLGGFIGKVFGLQAIFWVLIPLFLILGAKIYFKSSISPERPFNETSK